MSAFLTSHDNMILRRESRPSAYEDIALLGKDRFKAELYQQEILVSEDRKCFKS